MRARRQTAPAINILEKSDHYCIEMAAPGMCKEELKLSVDAGNHLVVSFEKMDRKEEDSTSTHDAKGEEQGASTSEHKAVKPLSKVQQEPTYLRREFSYSSFRQSFLLPDEVDSNHIEATMKHGVLYIRLPKKEEQHRAAASRMIEIK